MKTSSANELNVIHFFFQCGAAKCNFPKIADVPFCPIDTCGFRQNRFTPLSYFCGALLWRIQQRIGAQGRNTKVQGAEMEG